jgi:hypothetical protein
MMTFRDLLQSDSSITSEVYNSRDASPETPRNALEQVVNKVTPLRIQQSPSAKPPQSAGDSLTIKNRSHIHHIGGHLHAHSVQPLPALLYTADLLLKSLNLAVQLLSIPRERRHFLESPASSSVVDHVIDHKALLL